MLALSSSPNVYEYEYNKTHKRFVNELNQNKFNHCYCSPIGVTLLVGITVKHLIYAQCVIHYKIGAIKISISHIEISLKM